MYNKRAYDWSLGHRQTKHPRDLKRRLHVKCYLGIK